MQMQLFDDHDNVSLAVLDELILAKENRNKRTARLLKDPGIESTPDWYICVPSFFHNALDIQLAERVKTVTIEEPGQEVKKVKKIEQVWMQGSSFNFEEGSTLYDTIDGYLEWSEAIQKINVCIQVVRSAGVIPETADQARDPGSVTFKIFIPDGNRTILTLRGEHTMSHDDFIRFLIIGPVSEELKNLTG
jgi:hypothetical protein